MSNQVLIEISAAVFGVLGTLLLALNGPRAGWGFVAYLVSNAGWIAFAWIHAHWALLAQQLAFTVSSLLGVWVWLVKPLRENWPMALCTRINSLSDWVMSEGLERKPLPWVALAVSNALDDIALRLYLRFKPPGQTWNPVYGRWEPEQS